MTTMGYLQDDRSNLQSTAMQAFNRRKQLCPFELTSDEMIDVMHPPMTAGRIRDLMSMSPKSLHWDKESILHLPTGVEKLPTIIIHLETRIAMPMAVDYRGPHELYTKDQATTVRCWTGPQTVRLLDWAWKATQVELENRWAMRIIAQLIQKTTTHQQVHRYMPELYALLSHQQEIIPANGWTKRRIVDVYKELKNIGSKRATRIELDWVTVQDRSNLKSLVTQALLLPIHDGLKDGTEFDGTWVQHPR